MLHAANEADMAVPTLIQRKTFVGGTERSAIAPKKSGDSMAAIADAANAHGFIELSRASSRTLLSGTNQDPKAIP